MKRTLISTFVVGALALSGAACGDDGGGNASPSGPESDGSFPITIDAPNGEVTIEAQPERIVSISPTGTEMLFAIGAGDLVVAADEFSNYPEDAPTNDDLALGSPNVEGIIGFEPDLVVLSDGSEDVVGGLERVDIPVLVEPAATTLDDTYTQIEQLGAATGHVSEAAELVGQMQSDIDELVAEVPDRDEPLTYYHELDDTLFSVTSNTFIGQLYELAGLTNIADAAQADAGDYPQLSREYMVDEDPDFVFLADTKCCGQNAETFGARPGFGELTAVVDGNIVELDDDIASRWGPRVVDLLRTIVEATAPVPANQ